MRRGLSIFLVLIFSLGPLTTLSPASEDASLPACCRRNGKHHCAMTMQMMAANIVVAPGAPPILKAPSHCPYYPQHSTVRNAPVHALAASFGATASLMMQPHRSGAGRAAPLVNPIRPLAGRGPPAGIPC